LFARLRFRREVGSPLRVAQHPWPTQSEVNPSEFNTCCPATVNSRKPATAMANGTSRTNAIIMLRPMLKSWLDDNLSGLVERRKRSNVCRDRLARLAARDVRACSRGTKRVRLAANFAKLPQRPRGDRKLTALSTVAGTSDRTAASSRRRPHLRCSSPTFADVCNSAPFKKFLHTDVFGQTYRKKAPSNATSFGDQPE
jgi:hypothetical protein